MYSREMLADIFTAWLKIGSSPEKEGWWLMRWLQNQYAWKRESRIFLQALQGVDSPLKSRFEERFVETLRLTTARRRVPRRLLFHLLTIAKGVRCTSFRPFLTKMQVRGWICGKWQGCSISQLHHDALLACIRPCPMATADMECVATSCTPTRRSRA